MYIYIYTERYRSFQVNLVQHTLHMIINCVSGNDELYSKELVTDSISGG